MENKDLIEKAKTGDPEAMELLFKKYQPIVLKMKKTFFVRDLELDDWLQEGRIICHKSLQNYHLDQGVTFGKFFKINFERHIIGLIRKQEALKRRSYRYAESLEGQGELTLNVREDRSSMISLDYVLIRDSMQDFGEQLSQTEKDVFSDYARGKSETEIATTYQLARKQVVGALARARQKLKRQLND
ncbi:sigma-70 family RNA polymerase sigma factor [Vagococcus sp.]|uniref:sigma-70 family RNA polymerase sigma factor n=1 Tax=Vagococcus sp. TaxID=1933889 RepID=UPI003F9A934A